MCALPASQNEFVVVGTLLFTAQDKVAAVAEGAANSSTHLHTHTHKHIHTHTLYSGAEET